MTGLDRSWARPLPTRAQLRADVVIAVVAAVVSVLSVETLRSASGASVGWRGVEAYLWFALAGLVLAGRRRFPLAVAVVESVIFVIVGERFLQLAGAFTIQMTLFAALYGAWAWSRRPRMLLVVTAAVVVGMFGWLIWELVQQDATAGVEAQGLIPPALAFMIYSLAINVVYFFGAVAWGQAAYLSARRSALVAQQRERELAAQDSEQRRAVQAERVRIARDLHDVVAHHVSGIGVQAAGASRLLESRPERSREALERIETSSRQAVAQMHEIVGLLRSDEEPVARGPQPGLADVESLAVTSERPRVEVSTVGTPFEVSATVGASLYRVVQEAVTNARKHSSAPSVRVAIRYLEESRPAVEVEVVDDGPERPAPVGESERAGGGFGLDGIRERAVMHGGTADIGPRPTGGFRVRVRIPTGSEETP